MQSNVEKPTEPSISKLEELFATFNQVSVDLGSRYQELQARVAKLSSELAVTHSARVKELTAKEQLAAKLSSLMDTLPGGVVVLDAVGVVREENAVTRRLFGASVVNKNWQIVLRSAGQKDSIPGGEISLSNGTRLCISSSEYGDAGEEVVLLTDVSENYHLRNLINREERLTALGEMSARLAHQVRTPLSTAILYLSHLPSTDNQQTAAIVQKIHDRLRQIESLTDGMLSYIRGEVRVQGIFSLAGVLQEVRDANVLQLRQCNGTLSLHLPGDSCPFIGDKEAIFNAIFNLVENAIQATESAPRIEISLEQRATTYRISVADNGPGIDDAIKEQIFDPFFSGRVGGTGLGLAVVLSAVRACSGEITIGTSSSGGARIDILLPVTNAESLSDSGFWVRQDHIPIASTPFREVAHG